MTEELQQNNLPQENENLENVYKSVSDEYIKKNRKKRVISFSIISSLLLILSIAIITLACVKIDLSPKFIAEPSRYQIVTSNTSATIDSESENYDEFISKYNSCFSTSVLTALFTGNLGGYRVEESSKYFYSSETSGVGSGISSSLKDSLGSNYIHLYYGVEQKIYANNGKIYHSAFNTTDYQLSYTDVYIPLSTTNESKDVTFYFGTKLYSQSTDTINSGKATITSITVRANTYALYDMIENA